MVETPVSADPFPTKKDAATVPAVPLIVTPLPTLITFVAPSKIMDEVPTVRIPVTLAFPLTHNAVFAYPTGPTSR